MGNENSIKLNKYKIKSLFKNIRKLNGGKNLLARKLNITSPTLDEYLKMGQELLDQNEDKLIDIYDINIDEIDEELSKTKQDYIKEFLELEGGLDSVISDKNKNAFEVFFIDKKENMKEQIIYDYQKEIIDNIKWSEDEKENEKIRMLMLFKLIYDRAQMSLDEELLYLKNKYAKNSSRNLSYLIKDLERRNKEDFGEDKTSSQKQITVNQQFNNFTHYCIEKDKALGRLKQNTDNVIDLIPESDDD